MLRPSTFSIEYDTSRLELINHTEGGITGWSRTGLNMLWIGDENTNFNGTMIELKFRVLNDAAGGDASVTLKCSEGDVADHDENMYYPIIVSGKVHVDAGDPAHVHTLTATEAVPSTCAVEGNIAYWTCSGCGKLFSDAEGTNEITAADTVVAKLPHTPSEKDDFIENEVEAGCETEGGYDVVVYCAKCGAEISRTHKTIAPLGHLWGDWTESKEAKCTEKGEETRVCGRDETHIETRETLAKGHTPGEAVRENEVAAGCETAGGYDEVVYCTECGAEISRTHKTIASLGHLWGDWTESKEAKCTEKGEETRVCGRDETHTQTRVIPALGHDWGEWVVTKEPAVGETGERYHTCNRCNETEYQVIPALPSVVVIFDEIPFDDVAKKDYFYDAVVWAYNSAPQIAAGVSDTKFAPEGTLTREQALTFIWRAKGCPEPTSTENPFVDVSESDYFYKAVLWAVEKGITKGVDETHFAPKSKCTTAHLITFLYRCLGIGQDGWNGDAEAWARREGLLEGLDYEAGTKVPCKRADAVLLLYRELGKPAEDDFIVVFD
ncbi:MAG: S-layer homology domain-containing protein [Oscillospiraceae bacterium]|nr:S-layer homology domain-containing protein [Oscillospiraceae bacterium]